MSTLDGAARSRPHGRRDTAKVCKRPMHLRVAESHLYKYFSSRLYIFCNLIFLTWLRRCWALRVGAFACIFCMLYVMFVFLQLNCFLLHTFHAELQFYFTAVPFDMGPVVGKLISMNFHLPRSKIY